MVVSAPRLAEVGRCRDECSNSDCGRVRANSVDSWPLPNPDVCVCAVARVECAPAKAAQFRANFGRDRGEFSVDAKPNCCVRSRTHAWVAFGFRAPVYPFIGRRAAAAPGPGVRAKCARARALDCRVPHECWLPVRVGTPNDEAVAGNRPSPTVQGLCMGRITGPRPVHGASPFIPWGRLLRRPPSPNSVERVPIRLIPSIRPMLWAETGRTTILRKPTGNPKPNPERSRPPTASEGRSVSFRVWP